MGTERKEGGEAFFKALETRGGKAFEYLHIVRNIGLFVLPLALVAMLGVNALQWAPAVAAAIEEAIGKLRDAGRRVSPV